jgi:hypothetical protein
MKAQFEVSSTTKYSENKTFIKCMLFHIRKHAYINSCGQSSAILYLFYNIYIVFISGPSHLSNINSCGQSSVILYLFYIYYNGPEMNTIKKHMLHTSHEFCGDTMKILSSHTVTKTEQNYDLERNKCVLLTNQMHNSRDALKIVTITK